MNSFLPVLAAVTAGSLIQLLITVVIAYLIFLIVQWAIGQLKLQEPFSTIVRVVVVLIIAVFCINALLALGGRNFIDW